MQTSHSSNSAPTRCCFESASQATPWSACAGRRTGWRRAAACSATATGPGSPLARKASCGWLPASPQNGFSSAAGAAIRGEPRQVLARLRRRHYAGWVVMRGSQDFLAQFRRAWQTSSRWLPQGWVDALRQLLLFAGAYYAYRLVRGLVDGQAALAFANARTLVDLERTLGLFFEPGL